MTNEEAIEILIAVAVCDRPILSCDFCARYVGIGTHCTYPSDKEIEESVLLLKGASNDAAISALRQQEHPNSPLTGWVSVKERLPEADVAVLARCFYNESWRTLVCHTSKRNAGEWYTNVTGQWVQVTNWMPLPGPPEEGTV